MFFFFFFYHVREIENDSRRGIKKYFPPINNTQTGGEFQRGSFLFSGRKHIYVQSCHRPPWRAWKHHHHHMWLQLLPTGPLVLYERVLLSNTASHKVTYRAIFSRHRHCCYITITQDKAGQRWDQQHGWAINGQYCGLLYMRYKIDLMAVSCVTLEPHCSFRVDMASSLRNSVD